MSGLLVNILIMAAVLFARISAANTAPVNDDGIAVIIGNKTYEGSILEVSFAHNDADAFRKFVIESLGYRDGNVIDLRDATFNQMVTVFGNKETHEGKLFDYVRTGESDVTVFYSGHGVPGLKDGQAYLLPSDGDPNRAEISGYPIATLYKNLNKLPARTIRIFIDACFSGETPKGMLVKSASGISVTPKLPKNSSGMTILTAAQGDQLASWDEDAELGLFTKHLLEALYGAADGKMYGNGNGKVTLGEVGEYLKREMTYQARRRFGRVQEAFLTGKSSDVLAPQIVEHKQVASVVTVPRTKPPSPAIPAVGIYPSGRKPGTVFKDCTKCPEMVVVPAGYFTMGNIDGDGDASEKPSHQVKIPKPFAVGKFEITFEEWDWCATEGECGNYLPSDWAWGRGRKPVININWEDAKSYVKWISEKTNQRYRLLSESEWEYVARAGATKQFGAGIVTSGVNAFNIRRGTSVVGSFPPNAFGLYDILGNVAEWTEDCWNKTYVGAPTSGNAWEAGRCRKKVVRGGAWNSHYTRVHISERSGLGAGVRTFGSGFRVARDIK